jgi:hypothetical protein
MRNPPVSTASRHASLNSSSRITRTVSALMPLSIALHAVQMLSDIGPRPVMS